MGHGNRDAKGGDSGEAWVGFVDRCKDMKIAVMGAGAIGSVLGGYLCEAGEDVLLIGRKVNVDAINKNGLQIEGVRGEKNIKIKTDTILSEKPEMLFLSVKTQDIPEACKAIALMTKDSIIVTMQNGVKADLLAEIGR